MTGISEDYDIYLNGVKSIENKEIREDYIDMSKFIMKKRMIIKIVEIAIVGLSAFGLIPSFLG